MRTRDQKPSAGTEATRDPPDKTSKEHVQTPHGPGKAKVDLFGWVIRDQPGVFMSIPKGDLIVDQSYQRPLSRDKMLAIARDWSWIAFGVLTVAWRPDGTFAVVDGQHRLEASLRRADIVDLPCMVFEVDTLKDEASGFVATNTLRKPVRAIDKFSAMKVSGDEVSIAVELMVQRHGFAIRMSGAGNTAACVTLLQRLYRDDPKLLDRVLSVACEVCRGNRLQDRIVAGLYELAKRTDGENLTGKWLTKTLRLGITGLMDAIQKSVAFRMATGQKVYAEGICNALNKGAVTRRLNMNKTPEPDPDPVE